MYICGLQYDAFVPGTAVIIAQGPDFSASLYKVPLKNDSVQSKLETSSTRTIAYVILKKLT